jgi:phenylacetate-CoA ligase
MSLNSNLSGWVPDWMWQWVPARVQYGRAFRKTLRALEASERCDAEELKRRQIGELRRLLTHAVRTVPFYRELHAKGVLEPEAVDRVEALRALPLTTKEVKRQSPGRFLSEAFNPNRLSRATTGGSSGEPFEFYTTREERLTEWAFVLNLWRRVGFQPDDWRLVLRGSRVPLGTTAAPWEARTKNRELVLSSYHLSDQTVGEYFKVARDSGCLFLHCHPSSAYVFAQLLKQRGLSLKLRSVLATSEKVFPFQRALLEEVFGCRVYSFYGQSEHVCLAGECERHAVYHVQPEYGVTEVLDADGNEVVEEGAMGEIVGTSFLNYAMPFIRYRTGDYAVISNRRCDCGRSHRLFSRIEGRDYDYVVARRGQKISTTALIFGQHFKAFSRIRRMQVLQWVPGEITLRIVRNEGFDAADETEMREAMQSAVAEGLTVSFDYVTDIPLSSSGKHRFMIQRLDLSLPPRSTGPS